MPITVGAGQCGVGGTEDGNDRRADGGGDVHRAAVVGDEDTALPVEFGEFEQICFTGKIAGTGGGLCVSKDASDAFAFAGGTGNNNAFAREAVDEFGKFVVAPKFGVPAGGRVDGNERWFCRWWLFQAEWKFNGAGFAAEMFGGKEIPVDSVNLGHGDGFVVEEPGAFAGVAEADAPGGHGGEGHNPAAQEALEVNDDVEASSIEPA